MVGASSLDALLGAVARDGARQPGRLLAEVLRATAGRRGAAVWSRSSDGWLRRVSETGGRLPGPDRVPGTDALRAMPEVALVMPVLDGELERGALTLGQLPGHEPLDAQEKEHARDAAASIALLLRRPQLQEELRRRIDEASRLSDVLAASHERLSYAAELESRRMVADIVAFGGDELAGLRERVGRMRDERRPGADSRPAAQAALVELRGVLDGLIERLRTMVRGIYPYVLHDRGLLAALQELAVSLPRPVRLRGDAGAIAREVESGLYWPTAAVLKALAGAGAGDGAGDGAGAADAAPVLVRLGTDEQSATVTVVDPLATGAVALRGVAPTAHDRLTALGGWLETGTGADGLTVRMVLPARLAPAVPAMIATGLPAPAGSPGPGADLRSRVRRLVHAALDGLDPDAARGLRRALAGLDRSPHGPGPAPLDGVPEALGLLDEVTRADPEGWLRYEYERLRADAHDLDELALIGEIRSGALALPGLRAPAALRLLGASGATVRARLGLADAADPAQVRTAAAEHVALWRACAESGAASPQERAAYRLLARSAEGLLVRAEAGSG
jgi:hypothetical protein